MQLVHRFSVGAPVGDVWRAFSRPEVTADCLPGTTIMGTEGDAVSGELKIKIGPLPLAYNGTATVRERAEEAHRLVIEAAGEDSRGHGTIMATINAALAGQGDGTDVELISDVSITGRAARFGDGAIKEAGERLLEQFESRLSAGLAAGDLLPPEPEPEPAEAAAVQPPVIIERQGVRRVPPPRPPAAPRERSRPPMAADRRSSRPPAVRQEVHPAAARLQPPRRPYVYQPPSNLAEPHWDALVRVGRPLIRRVGPPLAVAAAAGLLIVWLVRRPERE
jgi:uncharacterized protein